uniref:Putative secreted protein n=1 Tax=Panstrongylus lignarius TaxID=156445 RepID=A0A224XV16_9HEMI
MSFYESFFIHILFTLYKFLTRSSNNSIFVVHLFYKPPLWCQNFLVMEFLQPSSRCHTVRNNDVIDIV